MREKLSSHFYRDEFACKCGCGWDTVDAGLLVVLQWLRWEVQKPITINSGCRCKGYNRAVGGTPKSQHLVGKAGDIVVPEMKPDILFSLIDKQYPDRLGLICYPRRGFVHVDSRSRKYRSVK